MINGVAHFFTQAFLVRMPVINEYSNNNDKHYDNAEKNVLVLHESSLHQDSNCPPLSLKFPSHGGSCLTQWNFYLFQGFVSSEKQNVINNRGEKP